MEQEPINKNLPPGMTSSRRKEIGPSQGDDGWEDEKHFSSGNQKGSLAEDSVPGPTCPRSASGEGGVYVQQPHILDIIPF